MSLASEMSALRGSAGLSRRDDVAMISVAGAGALDLLQVACTQSPFIREGRVRHTLFLREDAGIFADVLVVGLGDWFLVLAEGPDEVEARAWLARLADRLPGSGPSMRGLSDEWILLGVDGPYAWEVVSTLLGPAVLGMPYLTLLAREEVLCVRAGKTGEYGYLLLVRRSAAAEIEARLLEIGAALDLIAVGRDALDLAALESWHFTMRSLRDTSLVAPLTPLELQLQWRVGYTRDFVGADALRARKAAGVAARATCFTAAGPVLPGQPVELGGVARGEVLAARASPTLGLTVGSALIARRYAHPHLDFAAIASDGPLPLRTCPAFLVHNLSLGVQPHLGHTYATRGARR